MAVLPSLRALPLNAIAFIFLPFLIRSTLILIFPNYIFCQLFYKKTKWLGKSFLLSSRHYSPAYRGHRNFNGAIIIDKIYCLKQFNRAGNKEDDRRGNDKMYSKLGCLKMMGQCNFSIFPAIHHLLIRCLSFANPKNFGFLRLHLIAVIQTL